MRQKFLLILVAVSAVTLAILSTPLAEAAKDPHIEWHKIETSHFEIVFDSRHYQLAKDFARHAETAWATLVPVFRTWPDKTLILIDDSGDQANGMATGFPYPQIQVFPATPTPGETIGDTGPWGLELITHEYTHVLNFQPAHGVFHTLRNLFGSIVRPNLLLPRWYLEGLAVEMETRFSPSGGRLRSPDFMAIPRAMVQDGVLRREDVSRIGETSIPDWPGGARPYLLGGLVWEKLAKENLSIVGDLNDQFARRLPFFIDAPLEERTGKDWQGYLEGVYTDVEARAVQQIEALCENGCNEGVKLGEDGFYSRSPVLSPTTSAAPKRHTLAFFGREHNHDSVLTFVDPDANGNYDIAKAEKAGYPKIASRLAWLPDGGTVLYDGIDDFGRYEERSELWIFERAKKKQWRVTNGLRAREPDISADGGTVAFVQLLPGKTQLSIAPLSRDAEGKPTLGLVKVVYTSTGENRISWPTFVDRDTLVFVERSSDGKEIMKVLDTAKPDSARAIISQGSATFPRIVRDAKGAHLLFASNRTGITNLYIADVPNASAKSFSLEHIRPLTNSVTRAFNGDYDSTTGNLIYSRLDGEGSHLRQLAAIDRDANKTVKTGKLLDVPLLIERNETPHVVNEAVLSDKDLAAHDFNVWPYLLPRYWMPYMAFVPGGAFISASTSSGDPMGRHLISLSASTDTRIGKPNFFAAYSNHVTDVQYTLRVDDFWQRLSSSGVDRRSSMGDLSGVFFIPGAPNEWMGELGVRHERTELPTTAGLDVRIKGGPRAGILWQDLSQKGYEISPEKGGFMRLTHARYLPELGNSVYDKTDFSATRYFSRVSNPKLFSWLADRHTISTSVNVSWLPDLDRLLLGPSSVSLPIETIALGASSTSFLMRGYPSGSFLGRKVVRGSVEYQLPLSKSYHGFGTSPAFIKRWHGAVFADLLTVDGAFYDFDSLAYRFTNFGNMFASAGAEARLDCTLFYHLPVQFIFGVHMGFDKRANPNGAFPVLSISL